MEVSSQASLARTEDLPAEPLPSLGQYGLRSRTPLPGYISSCAVSACCAGPVLASLHLSHLRMVWAGAWCHNSPELTPSLCFQEGLVSLPQEQLDTLHRGLDESRMRPGPEWGLLEGQVACPAHVREGEASSPEGRSQRSL